MAGGFLMALGGALQGYGSATFDQLKAEALAKREEALSQAKFERERLLAADTRQFESGEKQKQRDFEADENAKTRADTADYRSKSLDLQNQELELKRKTSGNVLQTPDGPVYQNGDKAVPITDDKGERVKTLLTDKDKPADVVTMEYLIQKGIAKDYEDAWQKVKQGVKADPQPADIEKMVETATKTEIDGKFGISPEEVEATRERNRARIMRNLNVSDQKNGKPASGDQASTGKDEFIRQSRENAKAAIAAGKPRDQVLKRLEAAGVDTTGL